MQVNQWRIKLRDDAGGEDLWPVCHRHSVVAITYEGLKDVDLRPYSRSSPPPRWDKLEPGQKGSISRFAWEIRGGDLIYVGDSKTKAIVGCGQVCGGYGTNAYRFDLGSPIAPTGKYSWCHLIDVDWDHNFVPFPFRDKAGQTTLVQLTPPRLRVLEQAAIQERLLRDHVPGQNHGTHLKLLEEGSYYRCTPAVQRLILREHAALSNRFASWLSHAHGIEVIQEDKQIDAVFEMAGYTYLVEFKIAYRGETRNAIREALGRSWNIITILRVRVVIAGY